MTASRTSRFRAAALAGVPIAAILVATLGTGARADVTFTSGSAFGISAVLLGNPLIMPTPTASGSAPPVNYPLDTDTTAAIGLPAPNCPLGFLNVPLGNIVEACVISASTAGVLGATPHLNSANSNVTVAGVAVGTGPTGLLTLNAVNVQCKADGDDATGSASLAASLLGAAPLLNGPIAPNTIITVPGVAEVALNEQYDYIHTSPVGPTPGTNSIKVNAARITLLDSTEIIIGHVECTATGPDVNQAPTTTTTTTVPPTTTTTVAPPTTTTPVAPPTTTTTVVPPTTTTTVVPQTTTTTVVPPTTTTTVVPPTTTTTAVVVPPTTTTTAVVVPPTTTTTVVPPIVTTTTTLPPSGTTVPLATTTTTKPPTAPPLPRTGSNLMPMVTMALLAIALGTLVRRGADGFTPIAETAAVDTAPPTAPEFRPIDNRPSALRRRTRRSPLDPATSDALSAFEADEDDDGPDPGASG